VSVSGCNDLPRLPGSDDSIIRASYQDQLGEFGEPTLVRGVAWVIQRVEEHRGGLISGLLMGIWGELYI